MKGNLIETLTKAEGGVIKYQIAPDGKGIFYTKREVRLPEKELRKKKGFNIEIYEEESPNITLCYYDFVGKKEQSLSKDVSVFDFTVSNDGKGDELITASIVTEAEAFIEYSELQQKEITPELINDLIKSAVDETNKELTSYKRIMGFEIRETEFEKTTTQKIKRYLAQ
ncbi:MAG: hypothetical protein IAE91_01785 [Ignavibacteriaceae bacterium]|nr:hypothetical protein [Ignavibacteriaceae bacterium]